MVGLRFFEKNLPDVYREELESSREEAAKSLLAGLDSSRLSGDYTSLISLWIPAVHKFVDCFKFSDTELQNLILFLYTSLFESDLSLDGLQSTLSLLSRVLKFKRHLEIQLDWKPAYQMYESIQTTTKSLFYSKVQISGIISELATVMRRTRKYFSPESQSEILETFQKSISPGGDINNALVYICNLLPNKGRGECTWVPLLLDQLRTKQRNLNLVINVMSCLATTSKHYPDLDWSPYLPEIYNLVLPSLPLLPQSLPRPKTYYSESLKTAPFITKFMMRSSSFAKLVGCTLSLSNLYLLEQWLQNMRSTIKEGKMIGSGFINYICRVVANYCKRIKLHSEGKGPAVSKTLTEALVETVKPYVQLIFYSGHLSQIDRLCTDLAYLSPESTIPFILENTFKVLEDYNIPHLDAVVVLASISRPLLDPGYPQGLEQLSVILNASLAEMTSADIQKSCRVLDLYGQIALSLRLDTGVSGVAVWAQDFFRGLVGVLNELEVRSESKEEQRRGFRIEETLEFNMNALCGSVSDEIFEDWVEELFDFVGRSNAANAQREFGILTQCFAHRDPERIVGTLLKLVSASLDKSEQQLMWRAKLLCSSLVFSGEVVLGRYQDIEKLVRHLVGKEKKENENEKFQEIAGDLLSACVQGLLGIYPRSFSAFLPSTLASTPCPNTRRGRILNQTSELHLEINWRIPSPECTHKANAIIQEYLWTTPTTKAEAKPYLNIGLPLLRTWNSFQRIKPQGLSSFSIPNGNRLSGALDLEEKIEQIVRNLEAVEGLCQDPQLLESLVAFVGASIFNEDYSVFESKKSHRELTELKRKFSSPLTPYREKNLNETRGYLIMKTYSHHRSLIVSSLTQKSYTSTYNFLVHVLLKLSVHQYKLIRSKAIAALETVMKSSFINHKAVVRQIWEETGEALREENVNLLKVKLELLVEKGVLWRKEFANSDFLVIDLLRRTHNIPDVELQTLLFNCFCNFVMCSYPDCTVRAGVFQVAGTQAKIEKIYQLVAESGNYHWRSKLYSCIYILLNVSSLSSLSQQCGAKEFVAGILLDENIDIRETGVSLGITLMYNHLKVALNNETEKVRLAEFNDEGRYLDLDHIESVRAYKVYHGWNTQEVVVKTRRSGVLDSEDPLVAFLCDPAKARKFIEFSAVSHMLESEEGIVKNPRSRNMENLNYAIKYLNNPHKFLNSLLSQNTTRWGKKSTFFSTSKAKLIKLCGKAYGPESLRVISELCKEYLCKEKAYQLSAIEILAGIGAASKFWEDDSLFTDLLTYSVTRCNIHSSVCWVSAFETLCKNQSPGRLCKIFDILLETFPTAPSKKITKTLKLVAVVIEKLSWRGVKIYPKLFDALVAIPHDNFADLRSSIGLVVSKLVSYTSFYSDTPHNSIYSSYEIAPGRYLTYYAPALQYLISIQAQNIPLGGLLILNILGKIHHEADIDVSVLPFLYASLSIVFSLLRNADIKLVAEASDALKSMSAIRVTGPVYDTFLGIISGLGVSDSKVPEMIKGLFLTLMWFYNQFLVSPPVDYFCQVINSNSIEIRQTGKYYLSMIWKISRNDRRAQEFITAKEMCRENVVSGVFRLSALVGAQNEFIESWKGEALALLCRLKRNGGEVALCVNATLAEFWKHHKMWWRSYMNYSRYFTEDQIEVIESCNSDHSYFA